MRVFCVYLLLGLGQLSVTWADDGETYELTYEVFSLPMVEAARLRREKLGGVKMHEWLVERLEKGKVKQEKWMILKTPERQTVTSEAIEEFIYGGEYDVDGIRFLPNPGVGEGHGNLFRVPPFPIPLGFPCFDIKYTGDTLEGELFKSKRGVELRLTASHIEHLKNDSFGKGVSEWKMPRFSAQTMKVAIEVSLGKAALVGTISPPKELQKEKQGKRVWWAFVTVEKTEIK